MKQHLCYKIGKWLKLIEYGDHILETVQSKFKKREINKKVLVEAVRLDSLTLGLHGWQFLMVVMQDVG